MDLLLRTFLNACEPKLLWAAGVDIKLGRDMCWLTCSNLATETNDDPKTEQKHILSGYWQMRVKIKRDPLVLWFQWRIDLVKCASKTAILQPLHYQDWAFDFLLVICCFSSCTTCVEPWHLKQGQLQFWRKSKFPFQKLCEMPVKLQLLSTNELFTLCLCGHDLILSENSIR